MGEAEGPGGAGGVGGVGLGPPVEKNAEVPRASGPVERDGQTTAVHWRPIAGAPRSYSPPLSPVNEHAPDILLWFPIRRAKVCEWSGGCWRYAGANTPVEEVPYYWAPLPWDPNELDYTERTGQPRLTAHLGRSDHGRS